MVCVLHTFGRDLKWNPHIHMLITEGACGKVTPWKSFHHFPYTMLRKRWMTTLLANLKSSIDFSRNSSVKFTKYIVRYIGRPAMAQSRITDYDGKQVTFWYQRHEDNKKVVETISAHDFIKRLIIHIPEKGFNMLRYYGLYAQPYSKNSHLIRKINPTHIGAAFDPAGGTFRHEAYEQYKAQRPEKKSARKIMQRWDFRISLSFGHDPLKCNCGEFMSFVDIYYPCDPAHGPPFMVK